MEIKFKKLTPDVSTPKYAKLGDAGMDLAATSRVFDVYGNVSYGTGLAVAIPEGYMGLLFPRSSNSKKDLTLCNSVGVIDSGYRGEIIFKFKVAASFAEYSDGPSINSDYFEFITLPNEDFEIRLYEIGEKIGQLIIIPYPQIELLEVNELSETERGQDGFGSTGK